MIRKSKLNIILFILGLMAVGAMNTSQAQILTPEIVVEMKSVTSFAIQPQGDYVAYTLRMQRGPDEKPGGSYSEIWVVSTKTGEAKQYTSQPNSASSPAWTPDGSKITFLSKKQSFDENTQVYAIPLNGGEARKLSHASGNIFSYAISPDGKMLAYRMRDTEEKEIKEEKKKGFDQKVIDTWTTVTRIHVENLANGKSRLVTEDDVHVVNFSWSPDGQNIIYRATNRPFTDDGYMYTDNYTVSAKGGKGKLVFDTEGKLGNPSYSPDGKKIAWLGATSFNDPATGSLFVIDALGGSPDNFMENFEGTAVAFAWKDANAIYLNTIEKTHTYLYEINLKNKRMKKIAGGNKPIFRGLSVSKNGKMIATIGNTAIHPNEIFFSNNGKDYRRLTDSNPDLAKMEFGQQETISWKGRDGLEISGVLIKPVGFEEGKAYPLQVQVHGGPESAYLDGWNTSYSTLAQVLAQRGYMVLMPNYRGSTGRGVAYSKGDHNDLMGEEMHDNLTGIDHLIQLGLVDKYRVGIGGGSYGGYTSAWAATKHSDRFKAAVVFAGIANQISKAGMTDTPVENAGVHWNVWLYDDMDLVWDRSPIKHIRNAKTPTLIGHGERDLRVPTGQAYELYRGLKHMKVPTELVIYPREPHGLRERAHQIDFCQRALAWYQKYLKGQPTN
jgi:dipeptidyl aminopeptidase/acylaminoacyl peptidase